MARRAHDAKPAGRQKILARLRSIEGHVRGVAEMVGSGAYCVEVLRQTGAVEAALERVNALVLEHHLHHCLADAIRSGDAAAKDRVLGELLELFRGRRR